MAELEGREHQVYLVGQEGQGGHLYRLSQELQATLDRSELVLLPSRLKQ